MGEPAIIDLFAGAGGLSLGAAMTGLPVAGCLEIDPIACKTLRANEKFHGTVIEADIGAVSGGELRSFLKLSSRRKLIVVGGAPCQPFSKAAYWSEVGDEAAYRRARAKGIKAERPPAPTLARPDARRDLVSEFWRIVEEANADGFVFENVPSIKHPRNRPIYDTFCSTAKRAGFEISEITANAAEYGVPQTRERVFVLGSRKRIPRLPAPTHSLQTDQPGLFLPPAVTAGEALGDLDKPDLAEKEEVVTGRWAEHLKGVPPGWNYKAHTAWAGHPNPTFETETRFWSFLLKLAPNRPSWTLAASPGPWTGPFHWNSRRLRTVEMSALQSFPQEYAFSGSRRERVRQIGNAVPPKLAAAMIRSVADAT